MSENERIDQAATGLVDEDTVLQSYTLEQFPEKLAVVRLGPGAEIPSWAESSSLFSVTATALETSIVCAMRSVPRKATQAGPFTAFAVQGKLDFALTGVLSTLLMPLAAAEISIFTISTFDTDWILVPVNDVERAAEAWRQSGHEVVVAVPVEPERPERPARDPSKSKSKQEKKNK
jgi:hypothetical protein